MHPEILSKEQSELLPILKGYLRSFYLVGGTAIAFHMGHRRSIDFDLFSGVGLKKPQIKQKLDNIKFKKSLIFEDTDQIHYLINGVKITFFYYPYTIPHIEKFDNIFDLPSLLDLSAMKAFALGRRTKWKDYVDLYFILKKHLSVEEISDRANLLYGDNFNKKLFRQQLAFHKDIDYTEQVEYLVPPPGDEAIKSFLIEKAIDIF
jgi:hypothetical protein